MLYKITGKCLHLILKQQTLKKCVRIFIFPFLFLKNYVIYDVILHFLVAELARLNELNAIRLKKKASKYFDSYFMCLGIDEYNEMLVKKLEDLRAKNHEKDEQLRLQKLRYQEAVNNLIAVQKHYSMVKTMADLERQRMAEDEDPMGIKKDEENIAYLEKMQEEYQEDLKNRPWLPELYEVILIQFLWGHFLKFFWVIPVILQYNFFLVFSKFLLK